MRTRESSPTAGGRSTTNPFPLGCIYPGCLEDSDYGAHGIRDGEVYDEYWCFTHYHQRERDKWDEAHAERLSKKRLDKLDVSAVVVHESPA